MSVPYNDYVLSTAFHSGWINEQQYVATVAALQAQPDLAALDFLYEQALLSHEQAQALRTAIATAEQQFEAESPAPEGQAPTPSLSVTHEVNPLQHDLPQGLTIDQLLTFGLQAGASDIHIGVGAPAQMRRHGQLIPLYEGAETLTPANLEALIYSFVNPLQFQTLKEKKGLEFSHMLESVGRFRASIIQQRKGYEMVFRIVNTLIKTMEELKLPSVLKVLTEYQNGLVLVTGAVGTGKSTTMAAMVEEINRTRHDHIITLEDPIEYVYQSKGCQITQREIHSHTASFGAALRASLREDPDVIVVGEMRDLETISLAITASETGHLVIGTLHTGSAARTLDRVLDAFPIEQQGQIRTMVSESLRGIISQQLVPRVDGKGRALAMEILVNTPAVANIVREGKTFMLPGVIQTGKKLGMKLMDDALLDLVESKVISGQEAFDRADQKKQFERFV